MNIRVLVVSILLYWSTVASVSINYEANNRDVDKRGFAKEHHIEDARAHILDEGTLGPPRNEGKKGIGVAVDDFVSHSDKSVQEASSGTDWGGLDNNPKKQKDLRDRVKREDNQFNIGTVFKESFEFGRRMFDGAIGSVHSIIKTFTPVQDDTGSNNVLAQQFSALAQRFGEIIPFGRPTETEGQNDKEEEKETTTAAPSRKRRALLGNLHKKPELRGANTNGLRTVLKSGHATLAETLNGGAAIQKILAQAQAQTDAAKAELYKKRFHSNIFKNDLQNWLTLGPSLGGSFLDSPFGQPLYPHHQSFAMPYSRYLYSDNDISTGSNTVKNKLNVNSVEKKDESSVETHKTEKLQNGNARHTSNTKSNNIYHFGKQGKHKPHGNSYRNDFAIRPRFGSVSTEKSVDTIENNDKQKKETIVIDEVENETTSAHGATKSEIKHDLLMGNVDRHNVKTAVANNEANVQSDEESTIIKHQNADTLQDHRFGTSSRSLGFGKGDVHLKTDSMNTEKRQSKDFGMGSLESRTANWSNNKHKGTSSTLDFHSNELNGNSNILEKKVSTGRNGKQWSSGMNVDGNIFWQDMDATDATGTEGSDYENDNQAHLRQNGIRQRKIKTIENANIGNVFLEDHHGGHTTKSLEETSALTSVDANTNTNRVKDKHTDTAEISSSDHITANKHNDAAEHIQYAGVNYLEHSAGESTSADVAHLTDDANVEKRTDTDLSSDSSYSFLLRPFDEIKSNNNWKPADRSKYLSFNDIHNLLNNQSVYSPNITQYPNVVREYINANLHGSEHDLKTLNTPSSRYGNGLKYLFKNGQLTVGTHGADSDEDSSSEEEKGFLTYFLIDENQPRKRYRIRARKPLDETQKNIQFNWSTADDPDSTEMLTYTDVRTRMDMPHVRNRPENTEKPHAFKRRPHKKPLEEIDVDTNPDVDFDDDTFHASISNEHVQYTPDQLLQIGAPHNWDKKKNADWNPDLINLGKHPEVGNNISPRNHIGQGMIPKGLHGPNPLVVGKSNAAATATVATSQEQVEEEVETDNFVSKESTSIEIIDDTQSGSNEGTLHDLETRYEKPEIHLHRKHYRRPKVPKNIPLRKELSGDGGIEAESAVSTVVEEAETVSTEKAVSASAVHAHHQSEDSQLLSNEAEKEEEVVPVSQVPVIMPTNSYEKDTDISFDGTAENIQKEIKHRFRSKEKSIEKDVADDTEEEEEEEEENYMRSTDRMKDEKLLPHDAIIPDITIIPKHKKTSKSNTDLFTEPYKTEEIKSTEKMKENLEDMYDELSRSVSAEHIVSRDQTDAVSMIENTSNTNWEITEEEKQDDFIKRPNINSKPLHNGRKSEENIHEHILEDKLDASIKKNVLQKQSSIESEKSDESGTATVVTTGTTNASLRDEIENEVSEEYEDTRVRRINGKSDTDTVDISTSTGDSDTLDELLVASHSHELPNAGLNIPNAPHKGRARPIRKHNRKAGPHSHRLDNFDSRSRIASEENIASTSVEYGKSVEEAFVNADASVDAEAMAIGEIEGVDSRNIENIMLEGEASATGLASVEGSTNVKMDDNIRTGSEIGGIFSAELYNTDERNSEENSITVEDKEISNIDIDRETSIDDIAKASHSRELYANGVEVSKELPVANIAGTTAASITEVKSVENVDSSAISKELHESKKISDVSETKEIKNSAQVDMNTFVSPFAPRHNNYGRSHEIHSPITHISPDSMILQDTHAEVEAKSTDRIVETSTSQEEDRSTAEEIRHSQELHGKSKRRKKLSRFDSHQEHDVTSEEISDIHQSINSKSAERIAKATAASHAAVISDNEIYNEDTGQNSIVKKHRYRDTESREESASVEEYSAEKESHVESHKSAEKKKHMHTRKKKNHLEAISDEIGEEKSTIISNDVARASAVGHHAKDVSEVSRENIFNLANVERDASLIKSNEASVSAAQIIDKNVLQSDSIEEDTIIDTDARHLSNVHAIDTIASNQEDYSGLQDLQSDEELLVSKRNKGINIEKDIDDVSLKNTDSVYTADATKETTEEVDLKSKRITAEKAIYSSTEQDTEENLSAVMHTASQEESQEKQLHHVGIEKNIMDTLSSTSTNAEADIHSAHKSHEIYDNRNAKTKLVTKQDAISSMETDQQSNVSLLKSEASQELSREGNIHHISTEEVEEVKAQATASVSAEANTSRELSKENKEAEIKGKLLYLADRLNTLKSLLSRENSHERRDYGVSLENDMKASVSSKAAMQKAHTMDATKELSNELDGRSMVTSGATSTETYQENNISTLTSEASNELSQERRENHFSSEMDTKTQHIASAKARADIVDFSKSNKEISEEASIGSDSVTVGTKQNVKSLDITEEEDTSTSKQEASHQLSKEKEMHYTSLEKDSKQQATVKSFDILNSEDNTRTISTESSDEKTQGTFRHKLDSLASLSSEGDTEVLYNAGIHAMPASELTEEFNDVSTSTKAELNENISALQLEVSQEVSQERKPYYTNSAKKAGIKSQAATSAIGLADTTVEFSEEAGRENKLVSSQTKAITSTEIEREESVSEVKSEVSQEVSRRRKTHHINSEQNIDTETEVSAETEAVAGRSIEVNKETSPERKLISSEIGTIASAEVAYDENTSISKDTSTRQLLNENVSVSGFRGSHEVSAESKEYRTSAEDQIKDAVCSHHTSSSAKCNPHNKRKISEENIDKIYFLRDKLNAPKSLSKEVIDESKSVSKMQTSHEASHEKAEHILSVEKDTKLGALARSKANANVGIMYDTDVTKETSHGISTESNTIDSTDMHSKLISTETNEQDISIFKSQASHEERFVSQEKDTSMNTQSTSVTKEEMEAHRTDVTKELSEESKIRNTLFELRNKLNTLRSFISSEEFRKNRNQFLSKEKNTDIHGIHTSSSKSQETKLEQSIDINRETSKELERERKLANLANQLNSLASAEIENEVLEEELSEEVSERIKKQQQNKHENNVSVSGSASTKTDIDVHIVDTSKQVSKESSIGNKLIGTTDEDLIGSVIAQKTDTSTLKSEISHGEISSLENLDRNSHQINTDEDLSLQTSSTDFTDTKLNKHHMGSGARHVSKELHTENKSEEISSAAHATASAESVLGDILALKSKKPHEVSNENEHHRLSMEKETDLRTKEIISTEGELYDKHLEDGTAEVSSELSSESQQIHAVATEHSTTSSDILQEENTSISKSEISQERGGHIDSVEEDIGTRSRAAIFAGAKANIQDSVDTTKEISREFDTSRELLQENVSLLKSTESRAQSHEKKNHRESVGGDFELQAAAAASAEAEMDINRSIDTRQDISKELHIRNELSSEEENMSSIKSSKRRNKHQPHVQQNTKLEISKELDAGSNLRDILSTAHSTVSSETIAEDTSRSKSDVSEEMLHEKETELQTIDSASSEAELVYGASVGTREEVSQELNTGSDIFDSTESVHSTASLQHEDSSSLKSTMSQEKSQEWKSYDAGHKIDTDLETDASLSTEIDAHRRNSVQKENGISEKLHVGSKLSDISTTTSAEAILHEDTLNLSSEASHEVSQERRRHNSKENHLSLHTSADATGNANAINHLIGNTMEVSEELNSGSQIVDVTHSTASNEILQEEEDISNLNSETSQEMFHKRKNLIHSIEKDIESQERIGKSRETTEDISKEMSNGSRLPHVTADAHSSALSGALLEQDVSSLKSEESYEIFNRRNQHHLSGENSAETHTSAAISSETEIDNVHSANMPKVTSVESNTGNIFSDLLPTTHTSDSRGSHLNEDILSLKSEMSHEISREQHHRPTSEERHVYAKTMAAASAESQEDFVNSVDKSEEMREKLNMERNMSDVSKAVHTAASTESLLTDGYVSSLEASNAWGGNHISTEKDTDLLLSGTSFAESKEDVESKAKNTENFSREINPESQAPVHFDASIQDLFEEDTSDLKSVDSHEDRNKWRNHHDNIGKHTGLHTDIVTSAETDMDHQKYTDRIEELSKELNIRSHLLDISTDASTETHLDDNVSDVKSVGSHETSHERRHHHHSIDKHAQLHASAAASAEADVDHQKHTDKIEGLSKELNIGSHLLDISTGSSTETHLDENMSNIKSVGSHETSHERRHRHHSGDKHAQLYASAAASAEMDTDHQKYTDKIVGLSKELNIGSQLLDTSTAASRDTLLNENISNMKSVGSHETSHETGHHHHSIDKHAQLRTSAAASAETDVEHQKSIDRIAGLSKELNSGSQLLDISTGASTEIHLDENASDVKSMGSHETSHERGHHHHSIDKHAQLHASAAASVETDVDHQKYTDKIEGLSKELNIGSQLLDTSTAASRDTLLDENISNMKSVGSHETSHERGHHHHSIDKHAQLRTSAAASAETDVEHQKSIDRMAGLSTELNSGSQLLDISTGASTEIHLDENVSDVKSMGSHETSHERGHHHHSIDKHAQLHASAAASAEMDMDHQKYTDKIEGLSKELNIGSHLLDISTDASTEMHLDENVSDVKSVGSHETSHERRHHHHGIDKNAQLHTSAAASTETDMDHQKYTDKIEGLSKELNIGSHLLDISTDASTEMHLDENVSDVKSVGSHETSHERRHHHHGIDKNAQLHTSAAASTETDMEHQKSIDRIAELSEELSIGSQLLDISTDVSRDALLDENISKMKSVGSHERSHERRHHHHSIDKHTQLRTSAAASAETDVEHQKSIDRISGLSKELNSGSHLLDISTGASTETHLDDNVSNIKPVGSHETSHERRPHHHSIDKHAQLHTSAAVSAETDVEHQKSMDRIAGLSKELNSGSQLLDISTGASTEIHLGENVSDVKSMGSHETSHERRHHHHSIDKHAQLHASAAASAETDMDHQKYTDKSEGLSKKLNVGSQLLDISTGASTEALLDENISNIKSMGSDEASHERGHHHHSSDKLARIHTSAAASTEVEVEHQKSTDRIEGISDELNTGSQLLDISTGASTEALLNENTSNIKSMNSHETSHERRHHHHSIDKQAPLHTSAAASAETDVEHKKATGRIAGLSKELNMGSHLLDISTGASTDTLLDENISDIKSASSHEASHERKHHHNSIDKDAQLHTSASASAEAEIIQNSVESVENVSNELVMTSKPSNAAQSIASSEILQEDDTSSWKSELSGELSRELKDQHNVHSEEAIGLQTAATATAEAEVDIKHSGVTKEISEELNEEHNLSDVSTVAHSTTSTEILENDDISTLESETSHEQPRRRKQHRPTIEKHDKLETTAITSAETAVDVAESIDATIEISKGLNSGSKEHSFEKQLSGEMEIDDGFIAPSYINSAATMSLEAISTENDNLSKIDTTEKTSSEKEFYPVHKEIDVGTSVRKSISIDSSEASADLSARGIQKDSTSETFDSITNTAEVLDSRESSHHGQSAMATAAVSQEAVSTSMKSDHSKSASCEGHMCHTSVEHSPVLPTSPLSPHNSKEKVHAIMKKLNSAILDAALEEQSAETDITEEVFDEQETVSSEKSIGENSHRSLELDSVLHGEKSEDLTSHAVHEEKIYSKEASEEHRPKIMFKNGIHNNKVPHTMPVNILPGINIENTNELLSEEIPKSTAITVTSVGATTTESQQMETTEDIEALTMESPEIHPEKLRGIGTGIGNILRKPISKELEELPDSLEKPHRRPLPIKLSSGEFSPDLGHAEEVKGGISPELFIHSPRDSIFNNYPIPISSQGDDVSSNLPKRFDGAHSNLELEVPNTSNEYVISKSIWPSANTDVHALRMPVTMPTAEWEDENDELGETNERLEGGMSPEALITETDTATNNQVPVSSKESFHSRPSLVIDGNDLDNETPVRDDDTDTIASADVETEAIAVATTSKEKLESIEKVSCEEEKYQSSKDASDSRMAIDTGDIPTLPLNEELYGGRKPTPLEALPWFKGHQPSPSTPELPQKDGTEYANPTDDASNIHKLSLVPTKNGMSLLPLSKELDCIDCDTTASVAGSGTLSNEISAPDQSLDKDIEYLNPGSLSKPLFARKSNTDIYVVKKFEKGPVRITRMNDGIPPLVTFRLIPRKVYEQVRRILETNQLSYSRYPELPAPKN